MPQDDSRAMRLACEKIVEMATTRTAAGGAVLDSTHWWEMARVPGGGSVLGVEERPAGGGDPESGAAVASLGVSPQAQQLEKQQRKAGLSCSEGIDMVVVEAELKVALGYRNKDGHRTWRKIKV